MSVQRSMRLGAWVVVWLFGAAAAQTPLGDRAALQSGIDQVRSARAELLAPRSYAASLSALQALDKDLAAQAKPERVQKKQAELQQQIARTEQVLAHSNKTLQTVIKAYDDAVQAKAPQTMGEVWMRAEQRFAQAVAKVEADDLDAARNKGAEAEVLLREVELLAIKQAVLGQARAQITEAQLARVPEFAPRSFALAQQRLAQADQLLSGSRYELAEPQRLAAQASYEVRHARYLAAQIAQAQGRDGSKQQLAEQQWLEIEEPLRELLSELGMSDGFDQGYVAVVRDARVKLQQLQQQLTAARQDVRDRDQQIADMNATITKLETRLGGESEERQALVKQLSAQERLRDNVARIEALFNAGQGRVYRQSNQLVLSLNAISFRSGKSNIEPDSFPVLAKVGEVVKLFPGAAITIEGHTDSAGSDSANLLLSQDRADAVRQYLISNLGVSTERVSAIGYGETKPVASNDSESGRARNRRIDVVLQLDAN